MGEEFQKVLLLRGPTTRQGPPSGQTFVETAACRRPSDCNQETFHCCYLGTHQIFCHLGVYDLATCLLGQPTCLLVAIPVIDLARQVLASGQKKKLLFVIISMF